MSSESTFNESYLVVHLPFVIFFSTVSIFLGRELVEIFYWNPCTLIVYDDNLFYRQDTIVVIFLSKKTEVGVSRCYYFDLS